jgi:hypothetical protein
MAVELPLLTVAMTRLPGGEVHLAAMGSLVYPLSIFIEAPVIMLLAASTAIVHDLAAHERLRRFVHVLGGALTLLHVLVAFTPLFDLVARGLIDVPEPLVGPGRIGMQIMTPWTWSIAYRRFQQGVLIRCDRSDLVVRGTVFRLLASVAALGLGLLVGTWPGIVVGASGVACGVVAEALWAGRCFRRAARPRLAAATAAPPLPWRAFLAFYVPLACTPLIAILIQPIGTWAMSKMAAPMVSLAAWPAVHGIVFMTRSAGMAYNEVVVTLAGAPGGVAALRRGGLWMAVATTAVLLLLALSPLGAFWFRTISGLSDEVATTAHLALLLAVLMPGFAVVQNYHQGFLVHERRTRHITEAVVLNLAICALLLVLGVALLRGIPGIYVALVAFTIAGLAQTAWLHWRRAAALRRTIA